MPEKSLRLIHWKENEARERAAILEQAGYRVDCSPPDPARMRELRSAAPWAVIIDLTRLPSQGRDVALLLRGYKSLRSTPFIFIEGDPEKTNRVRELLPDSTFTTWERILADLEKVPELPPVTSTVPASSFAAYAGAPLIQKLGIRAGTQTAVIAPPDNLAELLGPLPEGARLHETLDPDCSLILWFIRSRRELEDSIAVIFPRVGKDGLWIAWPKLGSGITTDLSQTFVRKVGLENGLVDYKISSIDATWSGLRFARRKAPAG